MSSRLLQWLAFAAQAGSSVIVQMTRVSSLRLRWQSLANASGILAVLLATVFTPFVTSLNLYVQDWLLRITTQASLPEEFALVTIDERSLSLSEVSPEEVAESRALQLMQAGFPWSREVYAALTEKLMAAGARLVIFDVLFPTSKEGDQPFADALKAHTGKVLLAASFENPDSQDRGAKAPQLVVPNDAFREAVNGDWGIVNLPMWWDNKVRSLFTAASASNIMGVPTLSDEEVVPSLPTVSTRLLGGTLPENPEHRPLRFRYSLPGTTRVVSLFEIFVSEFWKKNYDDGKFFKDRIVLVGATAERLHDFYLTPWGKLSGPEINLHALAAMLRGSWLKQAGLAATIVALVFAGLAAFSVTFFLRGGAKSLAAAVVGGALVWLLLCAAVLWLFSYFLPAAAPLLTWLVCGFAGVACDVSIERRERGRMRATLERYVSRDVVREIAENPDSYLQSLGGQRKEMVVLFSDLKGFTSASERLDPAEMVTLLNEYFRDMVEVVFAHSGTLDKFIGDAIMATWGGLRPANREEDAVNALLAALKMKERLAAINERRATLGITPWGSGIGISYGPAIFGNIGSHQRMDMTVIGDTVNLASRIEGLTRIYGCDILVDERIARKAQDICPFLEVDMVRVKGRKKPERLFFPHREEHLEWAESFAAARTQYRAGEFSLAQVTFDQLAQGGLAPKLAALYRVRCEAFVAQPLSPGWEGIWDFLEK
jgi:adenylate cyclase